METKGGFLHPSPGRSFGLSCSCFPRPRPGQGAFQNVCDVIRKTNLAGHSRPFNQSFTIFAVERNERQTDNRSPFELHFRPRGTNPQAFSTLHELAFFHCKPVQITEPDCKRKRNEPGDKRPKNSAIHPVRSFRSFAIIKSNGRPPYFTPWRDLFLFLCPGPVTVRT